MNPSNQPPFAPQTWPFVLNAFLFLILLARFGGNNLFLLYLFVPLAGAVNVIGAFIAVVRKKWAVAAYYGLGLVIMMGIVITASYFGHNPLSDLD